MGVGLLRLVQPKNKKRVRIGDRGCEVPTSDQLDSVKWRVRPKGGPGIVEYAATGGVTLHWSRLLAGALGLLSAFQCAVFAVLMKVVTIWQENAIETPSPNLPVRAVESSPALLDPAA